MSSGGFHAAPSSVGCRASLLDVPVEAELTAVLSFRWVCWSTAPVTPSATTAVGSAWSTGALGAAGSARPHRRAQRRLRRPRPALAPGLTTLAALRPASARPFPGPLSATSHLLRGLLTCRPPTDPSPRFAPLPSSLTYSHKTHHILPTSPIGPPPILPPAVFGVKGRCWYRARAARILPSRSRSASCARSACRRPRTSRRFPRRRLHSSPDRRGPKHCWRCTRGPPVEGGSRRGWGLASRCSLANVIACVCLRGESPDLARSLHRASGREEPKA